MPDVDNNATPAEINMAREGLRGMGDTRPIRDRAVLFAAIPGSTLYICVINDITQYVVGTCNWDDTEWDGGAYSTSLAAALRLAADRAERVSRFAQR